jgi:hypothetical protein
MNQSLGRSTPGAIIPAGLLLVLGSLVSGCKLDLGDSPFLCNKGGRPECPSGYRCKGTRCIPVGECPSTVPGCPGYQVCGDGICGAGEDKDNCPKDCIVHDAGPDRSLTDRGPADLRPQPDVLPPDTGPSGVPYGGICSASLTCRAGLFCFVEGSGSVGFCTEKCTAHNTQCPNTPGSTRAICWKEKPPDPNLYCGFVCKQGGSTYPCPTTLNCNPADEPPGSGQHFCFP